MKTTGLILLPLVLGFVVLAYATSTQAQWRGGWGVDNRASTVAEGRGRAMSDVIRARGQYQMDSAQARVTRSEARSRELDNHLKAGQTYFAMRNMNREQRFGTAEDKYAHKRANEEKYFRHAQKGSPDQLSSRQLDPITGKINWPFSLMDEKYAPYRQELDKQFDAWARGGGYPTYEVYKQVRKASGEMLALLKKDIKTMETKDYLQAKNFINALAHQVEQTS